MLKKRHAQLALAVALVGLVGVAGWRWTAQGALPPPPDPDRAFAKALADDLGRLRGPGDLIVVPQASRATTPSLYNSAYLWAAMRAVGSLDRPPSDASLVQLARASTSVDPLWSWEWACTASADGQLAAPSTAMDGLRSRLTEVLTVSQGPADDDRRVGALLTATVVARCVGLHPLEARGLQQLKSVSHVTAEQAVRLKDLGLTPAAPPSAVSAPPSAACSGWDPIQDPARWLLARSAGSTSSGSTCAQRPFAALADPQAIYWTARVGAFDPAAKAAALHAISSWRTRILPDHLVAEAPVSQGSLMSTVLASQLFQLLGAGDVNPDWLKSAIVRRARMANQPGSAASPAAVLPSRGDAGPAAPAGRRDSGSGSGAGSGAVSGAESADSDTILLALGCRAVGASCPEVASRATQLLHQPLPDRIITAGQARQWIMVTAARRSLGVETTEHPSVEASLEPWTERGAVRTRLAAVLCQLGQCATGDTMGRGEPMALARESLAGGDLELATALFQLQDGRQVRTERADIDTVRALLARYRAPSTTTLFSWTPGGPPSMAASHAVYESALWLGVPVSELVAPDRAGKPSSKERHDLGS